MFKRNHRFGDIADLLARKFTGASQLRDGLLCLADTAACHVAWCARAFSLSLVTPA